MEVAGIAALAVAALVHLAWWIEYQYDHGARGRRRLPRRAPSGEHAARGEAAADKSARMN
jgi:hypothetical protein